MSELVDVFMTMLRQATKEQAVEFYAALREHAGHEGNNDFGWLVEGSHTHQWLKEQYSLLQERLKTSTEAHTKTCADLEKADERVVRLRNALHAATRTNDGWS